jgi:hypothetical protein
MVIALAATGQLAAQEKKEKSRHVRLLALGDPPPYMQEVRGGIAYELDPPPGSIPPRVIALSFAKEDSEEAIGECRLMLRRMSQRLVAPAGAGPLLLRDASDDAPGQPWLTVQRPARGDFVVMVWRDPNSKTWDKLRSMVLPDSQDVAPAGSLTIINLAVSRLALVIDDEKLVLPAGRPVRRRVAPRRPVPIQVAQADDTGKLKRFLSRTVETGPGERSLVVFFRADGIKPRQPVQVIVHRERVPQGAAKNSLGGPF